VAVPTYSVEKMGSKGEDTNGNGVSSIHTNHPSVNVNIPGSKSFCYRVEKMIEVDYFSHLELLPILVQIPVE